MENTADFAMLKKKSKAVNDSFPHYKLALLGDCATQHLAVALRGSANIRGLSLSVFDADYDQIYAQIADERSELYQFRPDSVLIVMCVEKLYEAYTSTLENARADFSESIIRKIRQNWDILSAHSSASILQFNFYYYNDCVMGSYALKESSSFAFQLQKLNYELSNLASQYKNVFLIDVNGIQSARGRASFYDDKLYYIAKMPFSLEALPDIAWRTTDVIDALRGRVKKCIVLDLDNTLWGGVIGDDGLEGIQIGELGTGHAFSDFQLWLKELKKRGILLTVCSKNNEETAKEPFEKHPDMVLRLDDFAAFVANWSDKGSNILSIQKTLNIGMDSIVFIDDNPFEREQVRSMLPEITVPELPADPAEYLTYLQSLNLFETASFSSADGKRTEQYRQESERATLMSKYACYDDYLKDLDMLAEAMPFDRFHYPRIAQLTQRSNQFNLRTVRYTEAQIEEIAASDTHITRYYTLKDKFGDYGLISVVILDKQADETLFISEWLMSCRVLKRGMEEFIVNDIVRVAKEQGYKRIIGEYVKTPKNAMVADIYERMGFIRSGDRFFADADTFKENKTLIGEMTK